MKQVKIAELKDGLSRHLRAVEQGASLEVIDRSRPIARIVPIPEDDTPPFRLIAPRRPFATIRGKRYRPARWARSSLDLLKEERRER